MTVLHQNKKKKKNGGKLTLRDSTPGKLRNSLLPMNRHRKKERLRKPGWQQNPRLQKNPGRKLNLKRRKGRKQKKSRRLKRRRNPGLLRNLMQKLRKNLRQQKSQRRKRNKPEGQKSKKKWCFRRATASSVGILTLKAGRLGIILMSTILKTNQ